MLWKKACLMYVLCLCLLGLLIVFALCQQGVLTGFEKLSSDLDEISSWNPSNDCFWGVFCEIVM